MPSQDGLLQGGAVGQLAGSIVERRGLSGVKREAEEDWDARRFENLCRRAHIHSDYALLANVIVVAEGATFQVVGISPWGC